jgi:hypothetical protein
MFLSNTEKSMQNLVQELVDKADRIADKTQLQHWNPHYRNLRDEALVDLVLIEVFDILSTYRTKATFVDGLEHNCVHPIQAIKKHFNIALL